MKEVAVQLGRPVNPNSVRQIRLAELESRKVNGTLKLGRPVPIPIQLIVRSGWWN
jgi:hypothetical protein